MFYNWNCMLMWCGTTQTVYFYFDLHDQNYWLNAFLKKKYKKNQEYAINILREERRWRAERGYWYRCHKRKFMKDARNIRSLLLRVQWWEIARLWDMDNDEKRYSPWEKGQSDSWWLYVIYLSSREYQTRFTRDSYVHDSKWLSLWIVHDNDE